MTIERKVGMGIAGQPSGATDVAEVFSTHLYAGNAGSQTITNGIDLAGEGGMVWFKRRNGAVNHVIFDTERWTASNGKGLFPNLTNAAGNINELTGFNSNGFGVTASGYINDSFDMASFTFRKKSGFFDCVTWTGNGTSQVISHGLDGPVGMIIVKSLTESRGWHVYHKSLGTGKHLELNLTYEENTGSVYITSVGDSSFTVGSAYDVNNNGQSYVAYLFADNSSEDADDQMIKCGSFTGTGSAGLEVNLGWEPQWVLIKNTSRTSGWMMQDTMRGMSHTGWQYLLANDDAAESGDTSNRVVPTATGFTVNNNGGNDFGQSGDTLVYMAIRAPMMKEPEAATDVFAMDLGTSSVPSWISGFPVDMAINATFATTAHKIVGARLTSGRYLDTTTTSAEASEGHNTFDFMNGWNKDSRDSSYLCWMWKRAKGYMDVVCYSGTGSARTVPHSLGVPPEMIWAKRRSTSRDWNVYAAPLGNNKIRELNTAEAFITSSSWNNTDPTSTVFSVSGGSDNNSSGDTYIAFLFATLAGISKVGSYSGNGTNNHVIDCGFTAGARFVLIRRAPSAGDWFLFDSVRGITSTSNDGILYLNNNNAQVTEAAGIGVDAIQPHSSGFQLASDNTLNHSELDYIFYAIA